MVVEAVSNRPEVEAAVAVVLAAVVVGAEAVAAEVEAVAVARAAA